MTAAKPVCAAVILVCGVGDRRFGDLVLLIGFCQCSRERELVAE
jgi:hypothetical protein